MSEVTNLEETSTNEDASSVESTRCRSNLSSASYKSQIRGTSLEINHKKVELYTEDKGPRIYDVKTSMLMTPSILAKNLPTAFEFLPIHGRPESKKKIKQFHMNKIREFLGDNLNDNEFKALADYCSPEHLKTGRELVTGLPFPSASILPLNLTKVEECDEKMTVVKKIKLRIEKDTRNWYPKRLKYRGVRPLHYNQVDEANVPSSAEILEPGKDLLFHVRVYRSFPHNPIETQKHARPSAFQNDVLLLGRHNLTTLRDSLVCTNDISVRFDVSENMKHLPTTISKNLFPSGFLFINNVFYVDDRAGCFDRSIRIRKWAVERGLGEFPVRSMSTAKIEDLNVKLGHPEVYMHQGNCEHLFTFSEIRLLHSTDPLYSSCYPTYTLAGQQHISYCTMCPEFAAKWLVTGCQRVPFDPSFFCDSCLKEYLYKDGKKICDFNLYYYICNEINPLNCTQ